MTLQQILLALRARWRLVAAVFSVMTLGALMASLLQAPRYSASASVIVESRPDPVSAGGQGALAAPALIATQVDIIRSERVAQRVVALLALDQDPAWRQAWQDDSAGAVPIEPWLVAALRPHLAVTPAREGSRISIAYTARDPAQAAALANAFVQAYSEVALELRTDPARQFSGFFEARAKAARAALEQAQARLRSAQASRGIVAADERLDLEGARLNELSSQLTALQGQAVESASRQAQAQSAGAERLREVIANPLLAQLKAEAGRAELQLQQLSTRLGDNHPQVQEARATLGQLQRRLAAETQQVAGSVGAAASIDRRRESQLRSALDEQRTRMLQTKSARDEITVLQRDVEHAQRAYDGLQQRQNQASLESQSTQGNVNVLSRAVAPIERASPKGWLSALLGALLGAIAAVAAALLLELRERRVRSADDVREWLGLPQLGVLGSPGEPRPPLPRTLGIFEALPHAANRT
jgi:polysaccharide biosynthesis transport protein